MTASGTGGGGSLAAALWSSNRDLAEACLAHPFVRGLGDGSLDRELFKSYVAQDAFFLRSFLAAYCLAAARSATSAARVRVFHGLIGGVLEELELHAAYAERLGIDLERVEPRPATAAYTDFLSRVAWTAEPAVIVAAMTPCMRLYAYLARSLQPARPEALEGNPYRDWVETYAGEEFEALAASLEALLDGLAEDGSAVRDAYRYAMRCELEFFDSAARRGGELDPLDRILSESFPASDPPPWTLGVESRKVTREAPPGKGQGATSRPAERPRR